MWSNWLCIRETNPVQTVETGLIDRVTNFLTQRVDPVKMSRTAYLAHNEMLRYTYVLI